MNKSLDTDTTMDENKEPETKSNRSSVGFEGGLKRMALNNTKAGMEGLDVDRINQIIEEASRGSKFYIHQQTEQQKLNTRMQSIRDAYEHLSDEQIQRSTSMMDKMAEKLEFERVLNRTIVHVDMDAYYAAVEIRDNPSLSNIPMAVGGDSMLSTSNYLARKFGVRAGMPGFIGKKLCPQLVIVPCNYEKYGRISKEIQEVFKEYDPNFCSVSLDEAYLDITEYLENQNCLRSDGDMLLAEEVTQEIRDKIYEKTQLTASAGIACNSLLAKICGDLNKPNGQYYLPSTIEAVKEFIVQLPIRKVSGIGNVTEQLLNSLKIFTCGDLWKNRGIINSLFKTATVSFLLAVSLGIGNSWFNVSDTVEHQKSISSERTFSGSGTSIEPQLCHNLCTDLERELISKELKAQTVTLKIKTVDFKVKTKAVRLLSATNEADIIFETAWGIYKSYLNEIKDLAIRLLGVRLSNFQPSFVEAIDVQQPNRSMPLVKSKKQGRIDHLLTKLNTKDATDKNIPKFECPICCTKFFVYNQLEVHVEICLSGTSEQTNGNIIERSQSCSPASVIKINNLDFYDKDDMTMPEYNNLSDEETFGCPSKLENVSDVVGFPSNSKTSKRKNSKQYSRSSTNGNKRQKNNCAEKNRKITDFATVGGV